MDEQWKEKRDPVPVPARIQEPENEEASGERSPYPPEGKTVLKIPGRWRV